METVIGMWIDHRKAVIVTIENKTESIQEIASDMEKNVRFSSSTRTKATKNSHGSTAEDMRDRQFKQHLDAYYAGIIPLLRRAESIYIFGPGEAKGELESLLKNESPGLNVVAIEPADKLTNPQIAAKVRDYFQNT